MLKNPLKEVFFPVERDILFTAGRRTEEGVARGDVSHLDGVAVGLALLKAGEEKIYDAMPVEGYINTFTQVVNPELKKEERADGKVGEGVVKDFHLIASGGLPNLDAMVGKHPNGWDYPYLVKDMKAARAIPNRVNIVWGYPEAVEAQGISLENYRWQDMVKGKEAKEPWQWTLLKVYPSGKTREILKVDEVPSDLLKDAVLITVGKVNPYNSEKYAVIIIGGRGGSTALGGMLLDRDFERLKTVKGSEAVLGEIDKIVENRPEISRGVQIVIGDWLEKGKVVSVDKVIDYAYL